MGHARAPLYNQDLEKRASPSPEAPRKIGYLPTLDGWRAIAILGVTAYHDRIVTAGRFSDGLLHRFGFLGVDLFFAISGLLICSRLLEEERSTGVIDRRAFYIRRAFRILPSASLYLAAVALLTGLGMLAVSWKEWFAALFFYRNYYSALLRSDATSPYTSHYWSLSIEEHFYLFLPVFLFFVRRFRLQALAAIVALELAFRVITHAMPALQNYLGGEFAYRRTELNCLGLMVGAWFAVLLTSTAVRNWGVRWITPWNAAVLLALVALLQHRLAPGTGASIIAPIGFPLIVVSTVLHPKTFPSRVLEWTPVRSVGRISYSLYLWQQVFFAGELVSAHGPLHHLQQRPYNLLGMFLCALASYFLVEKPFIRAGHRLTRKPA